MSDPYAGLGTPPSNSPTQNDPYAGLGTPPPQVQTKNPYAGVHTPIPGVQGFGVGTRGVMEGIAGIPDMISGPVAAAANLVTGKDHTNGESLTPWRDWADSAADVMGLPQPANAGQRIINAAGGGAIQALATGGVAGLVKVPGTLGAVAKAVASAPVFDAISGATSGAASQGAAEVGAGPWGQLAAGTLGGLAPGGVHLAAHMAGIPTHAPQFVQDLFNQRGVDTTPTPDPTTSPLSNRGMSPTDLEQYHEVLAHGTPEDIHSFVAQTKMAPLTQGSVNEWVARRDDMLNGIAPSDYADPMFHPESSPDLVAEQHRQDVEAHINQQIASWKKAPVINVVNSADHPAGADPDVLGFHDPATGQVHIFADRVPDVETANALLYHEGLGHNGLQQVFGNRLDATLNSLINRNVGQFGKDVDAWQKANPNEYGGDRTRAAEEVLAEMSEKGPVKPVLMDALSFVVRNIGRKMGMSLSYSDAEVRNILAMAHSAVINGVGRDIPANGFKGSKVNYQATDLGGGSKSTTFMKRSQFEDNRSRNTTYSQQTMDDLAKHFEGNYVPNKVNDKEVMDTALEHGISPSAINDLRQRNPGELAARVTRLGAATDYAHAQLRDTLSKLDTPDFGAKDMMKLAQQVAQFHGLFGRFKNESNELGRGLRAVQAFHDYSNGNLSELLTKLKEEGNEGLAALVDPTSEEGLRWARSLKQALATGNPKAANILISGVTKPYWEQYLTSFHFNAMLSSLSTHVKAPLDMMTGIAHDVIDHALAMPVGKMYNFIESITGQKVQPGISSLEVEGRVRGALRAVFDHEVHVNTLEAAKTGEGKVVDPSGSVSTTNGASNYGGNNARFGGVLSGINTPMNLITAQDTFFRSTAKAQQLYGLGARKAVEDFVAQGIKPTRDMIRVAGDANAFNPTQKMLNEAKTASEKSLLLNPNAFTKWIGKLSAYRPSMSVPERFGAFFASNLAPFMRVSSNSLLTRTIERSPLPLLSPSTWRVLAAGGPEAHLAISRMVYGTIKLGLMWGAAGTAKNLVTGQGPANPDKFKEMEAGGWRPDAVHENGQYNTGGTLNMSINPFDPHNSTQQMVKDARDAYETGMSTGQWVKALMMAASSVAHDFEKTSWIHDVVPALNAADARGENAGQQFASFAGQEAKSWVPGISNQLNRKFIDSDQRDTRPDNNGDSVGEIINNVKSAIPGLSQTLPIRYSVYGDPMPIGASLTGVHTAIPGVRGNGVPEATDPTKIELQRLAALTPAAMVTPVQRTVQVTDPTTGEKTPKKLTTAEFESYQQLAGVNIVDQVKQLMADPQWAQTPDKTKIAAVKEVEKQVKQAAREQLFGQ